MAEFLPGTLPEVVAAAARIAAAPGDPTTLRNFAEAVGSAVRAHRVLLTLVVWPTLEDAIDTVALAYQAETGTDPLSRPSPTALAKITAAGHTQSVHAPPSLSSRVLSAPAVPPGKAKALGGERAVAFFFPTGTKRLAAVLEIESPQDQLALPLSRDRFHTALAPVIQSASAAWSAKLFADNYAARMRFYDGLAKTELEITAQRLDLIARLWRDVTSCEWVWLWTYNALTGVWEFRAAHARNGEAPLPNSTSYGGKCGVAEYVCQAGEPLIGARPDWKATRVGIEYKLLCQPELVRLGVTEIDAVPLLLGDSSSAPYGGRLTRRSVLLLAYTGTSRQLYHPLSTLVLMGRFTAQLLETMAQSRLIQATREIKNISNRFLLARRSELTNLWADYNDAVLEFIKSTLSVQYCSIFYRTSDGTRLVCAASTGLWRSDRTRVDPSSLDKCEYSVSDASSLTVSCFRTLQPIVLPLGGESPEHKCRYSETPLDDPNAPFSLVIFPTAIRILGEQVPCGVIRCANPSRVIGSGKTQVHDFDDFSLLVLDEIVGALSVVSEVVRSHVDRELTVKAAKHDMASPLHAIRDLAERYLLKRGKETVAHEAAPESPSEPALESVRREIMRRRAEIVETYSRAHGEVFGDPKPLQPTSPPVPSVADFESKLKEMNVFRPLVLLAMRASLEELAAIIDGLNSAYRKAHRSTPETRDLPGGNPPSGFPRTVVASPGARGYMNLDNLAEKIRGYLDFCATWLFTLNQPRLLVRYYDIQNIHRNAAAALQSLLDLEMEIDRPAAFRPEPTYLAGDIIARLENSLSHYASIHRVRLKFDFHDFKSKIPRLVVDARLVERALMNLIVNGIKYGDPDSTVTIQGRVTGESYCVDVQSTGVGFSEEEKELAFRHGWRSERVRALGIPGDGFGLGIAMDIMKRHGGSVDIVSGRNPTVVALVFPKRLEARRENP